MKILIDTNIIIDFLEKREPFFLDSCKIIEICTNDGFDGCVAAHTITNCFYALRRLPVEDVKKRILDILDFLTIVGIDERKILDVLNDPDFIDLEDCLQFVCAEEFGVDYIVTRNIKDFKKSKIPALTPKEFLAKLENK